MAESTSRAPGRPRRVPQRTCISCRTTSNKRSFVRIVRTAEGRAVIDPTGKLSGRGAYFCDRLSCWEAGLKKDKLGNALKVAVSEEDKAALRQYAATHIRPDTPDEQEA